MNLKFPELRGGTVQGLNDAGVENFQGAIDVYLSRECGQNTGDAAAEGTQTVKLHFDRITMPASEIPGFADLKATLDACLDRWKGKPKEREFFEKAVELASKQEICVLRIADYGTTGLTGDDLDETGRWVALVKSQGVSNKDDTAGGSFGIGKSSPFAASRFRTVFYGTRTHDGQVALQGVSRLVTHRNPDGKLTQGTGFIGEYDPNGGEEGEPVFRAVREAEKIPEAFRRQEPGTDIWVIGYRSGPEWSKDLIRSILSNFWPAIHRGSIEFKVGDQTISESNLKELIDKYIGQEEFETHHFYKAITAQPISKTLKHTGTCELYLTASSPDLPREICMVRNTGMRIYDYRPRACRVPFSGLFISTDPEGNKLLRNLEPPKHDKWDPKRIEGDGGKKALDEIKRWIRDEVRKLNPLFSGSSFNENELAKYIADTATDEPDDLPSEDSGTSQEESLEPKPKPDELPVKPVKTKPVAEVPGSQADGVGGTGQGGTGGVGTGGSDGNGGPGGGGVEDSEPPTIRTRSYRVGHDGTYELVLRSEEDFTGTIHVHAVGEDGQREHVPLVGAMPQGKPDEAYTIRGGAVQDVCLAAGTPARITITLHEIERRALTAIPRK